jgi:hypothetical protein
MVRGLDWPSGEGWDVRNLLTIGRLAKEAGINMETVRYYERQGLAPKPPRTASGYRVYPADGAPSEVHQTGSPVTPGPTSSTIPDRSEPRVSGGDGLTLLFPSLMRASHGPTPAATTRTSSSPAEGTGRGTSSIRTTSGGPKLWMRAAFMSSYSGLQSPLILKPPVLGCQLRNIPITLIPPQKGEQMGTLV